MNWFKISIFSATCWNWITKFRNECEFALNWWHPTGSWIGMTKRVIYWILVQHRQYILGNCVLHPGLQKLLYLMSTVFYLSIVLWFYLLISIYSSIGHSVLYVFLSLYHAIISSITHIQFPEWSGSRRMNTCDLRKANCTDFWKTMSVSCLSIHKNHYSGMEDLSWFLPLCLDGKLSSQ